jgi:hypothetical protein
MQNPAEKWARKVNQLLYEAGYDVLFNDEEIESIDFGEEGFNIPTNSEIQRDAEMAFLEKVEPIDFILMFYD